MYYLEDEAICDNLKMAALHERVEYLESVAAAEQAEEEAALNERYTVERLNKAEEQKAASERLFQSAQSLMSALKRSDLPEELYATICVAICTQELARGVLRNEVQS